MEETLPSGDRLRAVDGPWCSNYPYWPAYYMVLVNTRFLFRLGNSPIEGMKALISEEVDKLGSASRDEKAVAGVFSLAVVLWITRPLLSPLIPGLSDTGIALLAALLLFLVPGHKTRPPRGSLAS